MSPSTKTMLQRDLFGLRSVNIVQKYWRARFRRACCTFTMTLACVSCAGHVFCLQDGRGPSALGLASRQDEVVHFPGEAHYFSKLPLQCPSIVEWSALTWIFHYDMNVLVNMIINFSFKSKRIWQWTVSRTLPWSALGFPGPDWTGCIRCEALSMGLWTFWPELRPLNNVLMVAVLSGRWLVVYLWATGSKLGDCQRPVYASAEFYAEAWDAGTVLSGRLLRRRYSWSSWPSLHLVQSGRLDAQIHGREPEAICAGWLQSCGPQGLLALTALFFECFHNATFGFVVKSTTGSCPSVPVGLLF